MRHLIRALAVTLIASLPVAAPIAASTAVAAPAATSSLDSVAPLSTAKVVIIVGPVEGQTSGYRSSADSVYAEAIKWSSNVVSIYSPNATWAVVKPALQGASVVVYMGHGNGWPSPYTYDPNYSTKDGLGLNASAGNGDSNHVYYGEPYLAQVTLAPNAVVLLNHLCYASGNSEGSDPAPTLSVAMQRVDNYGQGFIKAGALAVIAEGHGSINGMIRDLFSTHQTIAELWRNQYDYNHNEFSFQSMRSPTYTAFMDPDSPSGGYYRSLVGNPDLRTEDVTGVAYTPTDTTPDTLQSPGAATVRDGGATLFADAALTSATGSLESGRAVRVDALSSDPVAAAHVQALVGNITGWTAAGALSPQDSLGPQLWGADGPRVLSPNGDGIADALSLTLRFSESVSWTAEFRQGGAKLWETSGAGATGALAWNLGADATVVPDGEYTLRVMANDSWGNPRLSTDLPIVVDTALQTRLAGPDRYSTAAAISGATYAPGVPTVYLATGLNFPDALAGAAAAGFQHAPILLVSTNSIPAATAHELTRLNPSQIIVLGSTGAVSSAVSDAAQAYTTGTVTRLAGSDRYSTAAAISAATYGPGVPIAYLATGLNFPDALAGAAAAGSQGAPILLVGTDAIPAATAAELARLQPGRIIVLGGESVVSAAVSSAAAAYTAGGVTRLGGSDRFSTAAAISSATFAPGVAIAYVATGLNFPDALAGAAAAGSQGAPILLLAPSSIPAATVAELIRLQPLRVVILGSTGVVSESIRVQLQGFAH